MFGNLLKDGSFWTTLLRLTYTKMYIFNVYNLMGLELGMHQETIHTIYAISIAITPKATFENYFNICYQ